ncbi:hypothetical protein RI129_000831 [Pyrocoelia pectoralis]|uniref:Uncharacterized protein n=1 Tax=Pyrocoelia pectoralis TaxID=417401 RepID=A0AAN7ZRL6_9COLE
MSSCPMPPPALKDLPRVTGDLKGELESFKASSLKNAETHEKIVLPSAEDVAAEKTEKEFINGIEHFDQTKLKHTETHEKNVLPDKEGLLYFFCITFIFILSALFIFLCNIIFACVLLLT